MKRIILIIVIVLSALSLFLFLSRDEIQQEGATDRVEDSLKVGTNIGNLAPDFDVVDYDGNPVGLDDFRGKPVFLNFWAAWCPFCIDEMPLMADIQGELGSQYVTVAVNRGESLETAMDYSDRIGVTGKYVLLLDLDDNVYREYRAFGMPYSVFIDSGGVIRDIKVGPLSRKELLEKLDKIIK